MKANRRLTINCDNGRINTVGHHMGCGEIYIYINADTRWYNFHNIVMIRTQPFITRTSSKGWLIGDSDEG